MAKLEAWLNLYTNGVVSPWPTKEEADDHADKDRIECRKIEWEHKEPTRVADYLVQMPGSRWFNFFPNTNVPSSDLYHKQTHPIGQQPGNGACDQYEWIRLSPWRHQRPKLR